MILTVSGSKRHTRMRGTPWANSYVPDSDLVIGLRIRGELWALERYYPCNRKGSRYFRHPWMRTPRRRTMRFTWRFRKWALQRVARAWRFTIVPSPPAAQKLPRLRARWHQFAEWFNTMCRAWHIALTVKMNP